jgi:hypothetical protein
MNHLDESRFRQQVDKALTSVKTILDNARRPELAADVPHTYSDKYALAEYLCHSALAANLNVLEALGVTEKMLRKLVQWAEKRSVTLRFKSEEKCEFDREETRKVESATEHVTEVSGGLFGAFKRTDKVITKITEYFWKFSVDYEIVAFEGSDANDAVKLQGRLGKCEIITSTNTTPHAQVRVLPHIDVNITWLLQHIDAADGVFNFRIDRSDASRCRTPRRNPEVDSSLRQFDLIKEWALSVDGYLWTVFGKQTQHSYDLSSIKAPSIFVPILPLFENLSGKVPAAVKDSPASAALIAIPESSAAGAVVLPRVDVNSFLWEQKRSLSECMSNFAKLFPAPKDAKLISTSEVSIVALSQHAIVLADHYTDCIDYIENMLYTQLVSAIGKIVTPIDFTNYMRFHNRKLFKTAFEPRPFCHAIRRPDHYPEGIVSIECQLSDGSIPEPVFTTARHISKDSPLAAKMRFPINAATNVVFGGDRFLHAWVNHQFSGASGQTWSLVARARQFSSFILLVGRIAAADVFDPKAAMIIQNKDDLRIPLLMETLPTAKEFRDAVESMSPEQQRFCKAYRSMQLESTLFGLVIIQIKPQMEKLMNLTNDSLTKEIQLTQDLMEMCIKYQVPSDLLSFDELRNPKASTADRIRGVKQNVTAMQQMLSAAKEEEIKEAQRKAAMVALEQARRQEQKVHEIENVKRLMMENIDKVLQRGERMDDLRDGGGAYNGPSMGPGGGGGGRGGSRGGRGGSAPPVGAAMAKSGASPSFLASPKKSAPSARGGKAPQSPRGAPANGEGAARHRSSSGTSAPKSADAPASQPTPETPHATADELTAEEQAFIPSTFDMTQIPATLDRKLEQLDTDSAVRPTIINTGPTWTMRSQKAILADPETRTLNENDQKTERTRAFDLLDCLSRSGALDIECAELHVIVAATHCFEKSVVDTVIQDNVNPIEKVERSALIVASTIHDVDVATLIKSDQLERVQTYSPNIFPAIE